MIETTLEIPFDEIRTDGFKNIRTKMDEAALNELAASIQTDGLIHPLTVRQNVLTGAWDLIAGFRRYAAIQRVRLADATAFAQVPCRLHLGDQDDAEFINAMENIDRESLSDADLCGWVHRKTLEEGMAMEALAERLKRSLSWIEKRVVFWRDAIVELKDLLAEEDLIHFSAAAELARKTPDVQKKMVALIRKTGRRLTTDEIRASTTENQTTRPGLKDIRRLRNDVAESASDFDNGIETALQYVLGEIPREDVDGIRSFRTTEDDA